MGRTRQKIILIALSAVLFIAATGILFFLKRIPLPARLVLAATDYGVAAAILIYIRQKYSGKG